MTEQNNERGQGTLAGALARRSRPADQRVPAEDTGVDEGLRGSSGGRRERSPSGGRNAGGAGRGGRSASARRGGSTEYKQCLAYVRREVRDRVEQARIDPGVRAGLVADLRERGVRFKPDNPEYSALVELLLIEWLEAVDYGLGD